MLESCTAQFLNIHMYGCKNSADFYAIVCIVRITVMKYHCKSLSVTGVFICFCVLNIFAYASALAIVMLTSVKICWYLF